MSNTIINKTFNDEINKAYKPLTKDVELDMIKEAQKGNVNARNALINGQLRMLVQIARSYVVTNDRNDISELMAIGITGYQNKNGINNAIEKFDVTCGTRFITYSYQYIVNAIRDYSLDNRIVRVPRNKAKSRPNDPKLVAEHTGYAECRGMTLEEYLEHMKRIGQPVSLRSQASHVSTKSLDAPVGANNSNNDVKNTLGDTIEDTSVDMDSSIVLSELNAVLSTLTSDERSFLREHFDDGLTMQEIGESRNISRQAVSTRIEKILHKARKRYGKVK